MAFASDTFTDTAGTLLDAHTPSGGGTWTKHATAGAGEAVISDANRVRGNNATASEYYHSGTPATAEYDVEADVFVITNPAVLHESIMGRMATGAVDGYGVRFNTAGQWQLYKLVGGTLTSLGTFSQTLSTSTSYHVKLEIRDAAKKVFIDGVERISSADNVVTAAGKAGVRFFGRVAGNATDRHLDNFTATDVGGGAVALDGTSAGTSTDTGDLNATFALGATSAGTSTTTGSAVAAWALTATSVGTSTTTGSLTVTGGGQVALTGTSAGTSATTGNLRATWALTGVSVGTSSTSGSLAAGRWQPSTDSRWNVDSENRWPVTAETRW